MFNFRFDEQRHTLHAESLSSSSRRRRNEEEEEEGIIIIIR
jgi:hypothetical protein